MQLRIRAIPILASLLASMLHSQCSHAQMPFSTTKVESCHCPSMVKKGKKTIYFSYGFHRAFFTNSTIQLTDFSTDSYDFKIINARAQDDLALDEYFDNMTEPQYSFRIGLLFNNKRDEGIELNYDHVKYVVTPNQQTHLEGSIHGKYYDTDTTLTRNLLEYEHTDGANYLVINYVRRLNFWHAKNEKHWLSLVAKPGAGIVFPRSNTRVLGKWRDDTYHVAGYVVAAEAGLRYDFWRFMHTEFTTKGAFAHYPNVLLYGDGKASQYWFSLQFLLLIGFRLQAN